MKRSTVLDLKNLRFLNAISKNKCLLILCICFAVGLITGTLCYSSSESAQSYAVSEFTQFITERENTTFFKCFSASLTASLLTLLCVFISGTSMLGLVLSPLLIFLRGFLYGDIAALLYAEYGIKGIAFHAVMIIPPAVILMLSLLPAAVYSINFSFVIAKLTLPRSAPANMCEDFRRYCLRYALLCLVVLAASLTDALLTKFFFASFLL